MYKVKKINETVLAVAWFVFINILFFLPGSDLPEEKDWMALIWFDKWVHTGLFLVLLYLWSWKFKVRDLSTFLFLFIMAVLYGFLVELIQFYFIPSRSFDLKDLAADSLGGIIGLWLWSRYKVVGVTTKK